MKKIFISILLILAIMLSVVFGTAINVGAINTEESVGTETTHMSNGFIYQVYSESAMITGYTGTSKSVTIPAKLDGYPVRYVGDNTPNTGEGFPLTGIENITSVTIGNNVIGISGAAFKKATKLKTLSIKDSVSEIHWAAFKGCSSLNTINISSHIKYMGAGVFDNTAWLNAQPNGVVYVGNFAYTYKGTMPSNYTLNIKNGTYGIVPLAFYKCNNLKSINLPSSLCCIGRDAFEGTSWYNSKSNGSVYAGKVLYKYKGTVPDKVVLNNDTVGIAENAFWEFSNSKVGLKVLSVPDTLKAIGAQAFVNCDSLRKLYIPANVEYIGDMAYGKSYQYKFIPGQGQYQIYGSSGSVAELFANNNDIPFSNRINEYKAYEGLPAPKLKSAVSTSNGIKITWGKVQYAEKYRVFYKGSNGSWKRLGDTVNTSFVDDDVKSGSTYTYTVRPINSAGDVYTGSFDSKGISATYNPPMLATPQITGFESTSDGVKIKWNRVSNAYGYRVFYKGRNGWKGMGNTTETFFVDTDVSDEVTYTYTVRCIDKSGNFVSDYNNNGWNYTYLMPQLSTPQITKFESTAEGVKITWNKVSGAYGYRVFYLGRDGWKGMGNTTGNTFVDDDVRDGGTYTYTVRCIGQSGNFTSRYNTNGWKYTYVKPQLATPQITKFESTFDGVKITWNKVANAYGYRVFYLGRDGWKSMGNTTGNTFVDDDVRDGGTYTYTVRCINANGDFVSRYNTNGWKYTYRVPWLTTPQINSLKSTDNGVEIKWNKVSGAAQYRVFYKGANGSRKRLATTVATSFTDDDVRSGSTYTYTVRCVDASGEIYTSLYDNAGKSIKYVNAKADYIDKLMDTIDSWSFEDYRGMVAQSGFTFMDLDFDGVNEFIVQREGGTMRNFDAVVYTYKNGKVVKVPANEEFIQNNNFQYFYNTSTKKYLIVGTAVCAEGTVNNRKIYNYSLTYANNRITSDYYSACFVNVAWRSPSGKDEYHYYNGADGYYKGIGNHKEITEVQYNTINSNKLKNCVDCNMKRKFVIQYEWNPLSKAEKRRQMLDAYNAFTYTKH